MPRKLAGISLGFLLVLVFQVIAGAPAAWNLTLRSRVSSADDPAPQQVKLTKETWDPRKTAIIVCDMWDTHHCLNAVHREGEIAPRMNELMEKARGQGALIIHAPSNCMETYKDHPCRQRAQAARQAGNVPKDIAAWCYQIPSEEKGLYPLDQSDSCDTEPVAQAAHEAKLKAAGRDPRRPWVRQIDVLRIDIDKDAISDSGVEIWNLLEERGIKNVMLVGVHTNMCVLGRPFGLRQMAKNGKNVVLCRDLTDTMYNPARWPYVSHFQGTDLIVQHIEKYVCPTITSDQLLGGQPVRFKGDVRQQALVVISEPEYETEATLPPFVQEVLRNQLGLEATILDGGKAGWVQGFANAVAKADVLFLSVRRRAIPPEDMEALKKYLAAGKPLLGIRTTCHAFDEKGKGKAGLAEWPKFDPEVLGGNYQGHYPVGPSTTVQPAPNAEKNPILNGLDLPFLSKGSLYKTNPLASSTTPLLMGLIPEKNPEPVAWTNTFGKSRVFFTSLGYKEDFANPAFVKLLGNATRWSLGMRIPETGDGPQKK